MAVAREDMKFREINDFESWDKLSAARSFNFEALRLNDVINEIE